MNSLGKRLLVVSARCCRAAWIIGTLAIGAGAAGGCTTAELTTDAGGMGDRELVVLALTPDVGLEPGGQQLLRVRYRIAHDHGSPLSGERVNFAIFGDPQGSTLSSDAVFTDDEGVAQIKVHAGAVETSFEVRVSAHLAVDRVFYIQVSNAEFGSLLVQTTYRGVLRPESLVGVEFLLYTGEECAALTAASAELPRPSRRRSGSAVGEAIIFGALPLDTDHELLVQARDERQILRAQGCVEVPRDLIKRDQEAQLVVRLFDVVPAVAGHYRLQTELRLPRGSRPIARGLRPWADLVDCRNDPAQLLLDCILDAADAGDPLDCIVENPSPATAAMVAERGALAASGVCRKDVTDRGSVSLDSLLRKQIEGAAEMIKALSTVEAAALEALTHLRLASTLSVGPPDGGQMVAVHRLDQVAFVVADAAGTGEVTATFEAAAIGLAVPLASPLPAEIEGTRLLIGDHGLSLGFGLIGRLALGELVLEPRGLPRDSSELVRALASLVTVKVDDETWLEGCPAIERIVCDAARLGNACLGSACAAGLDGLASYLDRGLGQLELPPSELRLGGLAELQPAEGGGLQVEAIGSEDEPGTWTPVQVLLGGEPVTPESAWFTGEPQPR